MGVFSYFIDRPRAVIMVTVMVFLTGLISLYSTPRQDSPNVDFNIMQIDTVYPGATPEDVEIKITNHIEEELKGVDGIKEFSSFSIEGASTIFVTIDSAYGDNEKVKREVREAIDKVTDFPDEVSERPYVNDISSTDFPVYEVAVSGKFEDERKMRVVAQKLERDILRLKNVGGVDVMGLRDLEVSIEADSKKLSRYHVSLSELYSKIYSFGVTAPGATITGDKEIKVRVKGGVDSLEELKNMVVRSNFSGKIIKLEDVADVFPSLSKMRIKNRVQGEFSITLTVKRSGSSDVLDLSDRVSELVEKYSKNYQNSGISIVKVLDFSYYTRSLLRTVINNATIGFFLVIFALFFFLNSKTAFWVAFGIPFSIVSAYIVFPLFGINTNQITLMTMIVVIGMLVDDAIVIAENIVRHQEMGKSAKQAALDGVQEMFRPVLATVLTTMLAFSPILFMDGIVGKYIYTIPIVVIFTLLFSLIESIFLLPAHMVTTKQRKKRNFRENINELLKSKYRKVLVIILKRPRRYLAIICSISFVVFVLLFQLVRFELFPTEDFDVFYLIVETPRDSSLNYTEKKVMELEEIVSKIPSDLMFSYKSVIGNHYTEEAATDPSIHSYKAVIKVFLHPASKRDVSSEKLIEKLKLDTSNIKGLTKLDIRKLNDGPPVGRALTARIVGDNFKVLKSLEKEMISFLKNIKGLKNLESSDKKGKKEFLLIADSKQMDLLGITKDDLFFLAYTSLEGREIFTQRELGEDVSYRLKMKPEQILNQKDILDLEVHNNKGELLPLSSFVTIKEHRIKNSIYHFDGQSSITLFGDVENKILTSGEINKRLFEKFNKVVEKRGATLIMGGEEKETQDAMGDLLKVFIIAVIGIYFILSLLLNSFFRPFLVASIIPFGVLGVLVAFILHGLPLSFLGIIGMIGMVGVVVNDSLVMVTYLDKLHSSNSNFSLKLLIDGAVTRLRPVLLTTITTLLGLIPTVYGFGGGEPFIRPMILAMSWGLFFATGVTLLVVPLFYATTVVSRR